MFCPAFFCFQFFCSAPPTAIRLKNGWIRNTTYPFFPAMLLQPLIYSSNLCLSVAKEKTHSRALWRYINFKCLWQFIKILVRTSFASISNSTSCAVILFLHSQMQETISGSQFNKLETRDIGKVHLSHPYVYGYIYSTLCFCTIIHQFSCLFMFLEWQPSRCVNQIQEVCATIEKTINRTVQNTLDQLEKDCGQIINTAQQQLKESR